MPIGPPRLPSAAELTRAATRYLAQRAASSLQLRRVLERRIRRGLGDTANDLGWAEAAALLDDVVARLTRAGLVDDAGYAVSRARVLARQGLPAWRIKRALEDMGLDVEHAEVADVLDVDGEVQALRFAERKRLGRFRLPGREARPERELRTMLRAGYSPRVAAAALRDADDVTGLESGTSPDD